MRKLLTLLFKNRFNTRLRELMIMRIAWVTGSVYEWTQHWHVATGAGIPDDVILAVRDWTNATNLTAADRAILTATDESLAGKTISDQFLLSRTCCKCVPRCGWMFA